MSKQFVTAAALVLLAGGSASAQPAEQAERERIRMRQRIATMEAVLARAVSNGADNVIRQLRDFAPDQSLFMGNPQAQGLRLEGYGIVFDVEVPQLRMSLMWPLRYMAQDPNRETALLLERLQVQLAPTLSAEERARLELTIRDLEQQLEANTAQARVRRGVTATSVGAPGPAEPAVDPSLIDDPENAYRREVKRALIEAMIEDGGAMPLGPDEWLAIAARRSAPRDPLQPGSSVESSTVVFRIKGRDLAAFRAGQITLEEARARVEESEQ